MTTTATPDALFEAALGVVQQGKGMQLLAVHNGGRRLVARKKGKFTNAQLYDIRVDGSRLTIVVGTDPRAPKALLDGKFNAKAAKGHLEGVQGALDGSAPAPASPVGDHFVQKKAQVPWVDPAQDPQIELDGNVVAVFGR